MYAYVSRSEVFLLGFAGRGEQAFGSAFLGACLLLHAREVNFGACGNHICTDVQYCSAHNRFKQSLAQMLKINHRHA